jgi:hypothetical protein
MTDDDDILTGSVPEPDAEIMPAERAHARTFAELVDKTLAGRTPPAMSADDRALLEVATVIRAAHGGLELSGATQRKLVDDALRQAVGGGSSTTLAGVTPLRPSRARRWAPWAIATTTSVVAAAAILLLWTRKPGTVAVEATRALSRPSDALIGPIAREHSGDAGARLDTIFADRLDSYRERRWSRPHGGKR